VSRRSGRPAKLSSAVGPPQPTEKASINHLGVQLGDGAFDLHEDEAGWMWQALCSHGKDMQPEYGQIAT